MTNVPDPNSKPTPGGSRAASWLQSLLVFQELNDESRLAPWEIRDISYHYQANLASLTFLFLIFSIVRYIVLWPSSLNILSDAVLYAASVLFLFFLGVVVRLVASAQLAVQLTNRWSTFFIVSFGYSCLILLVIIGLQFASISAGARVNVFLWFESRFSHEWQATMALSAGVSFVASIMLWMRTRRNFRDFKGRPLSAQLAILVLSWACVWVTFYAATFGFVLEG